MSGLARREAHVSEVVGRVGVSRTASSNACVMQDVDDGAVSLKLRWGESRKIEKELRAFGGKVGLGLAGHSNAPSKVLVNI